MIEAGLRAHLLGAAAVDTLVAGRVFPLLMPQGSPLPSLVYQRIASSRQQMYCGTSRLTAGTFQIDSYAEQYVAAVSLAAAVRAALLDFQGMLNGVPVRHAFVETEGDLLDPEPGIFRVSQTWVIWYSE